MPATLYVTIDTEPDCDTRWNRIRPLIFSSITEGIPKLLRPIWDKWEINPIYFVCTEVVRNEECCRILRQEISRGAIIGTHLHSEYIEPKLSRGASESIPSYEFPCFDHDDSIESEKIENLSLLIEQNLGVKPVWYRAARYGADLASIKTLSKLGYQYDSSVTPQINWEKYGGPDHSKAPEQPYYISASDLYAESSDQSGIKEIPISIHGKRFGLLSGLLPDSWLFYRWLRPTHMSIFEQKRLIRYFFAKYKDPTLVLMFHSQEIMVNTSPYVRNKWMQRYFLKRLERTIAYFNHYLQLHP